MTQCIFKTQQEPKKLGDFMYSKHDYCSNMLSISMKNGTSRHRWTNKEFYQCYSEKREHDTKTHHIHITALNVRIAEARFPLLFINDCIFLSSTHWNREFIATKLCHSEIRNEFFPHLSIFLQLAESIFCDEIFVIFTCQCGRSWMLSSILHFDD